MARSYCVTNLLVVVISLSLLPQTALSSTSTLGNDAPFSYYQTFEPSNLGITFQYPSNWNKFDAGLDPSIVSDFLGVASFDIVNNADKRSYPYRNSEDSYDYSGLMNPILSVVSLKLPSHNLELEVPTILDCYSLIST